MASTGQGQDGQTIRQRGQGTTHAIKQPASSATRALSAKAFMAKDLEELEGFHPHRLEFQWEHTDHQLTDKFFADHYAAIVSNVKLHVDDMFRVGDILPRVSVWSVDTERKDRALEHIIQQIARPNPLDPNPWDDLMTCNTKRIAIMRAVFLMMFSRQLFSMQLFGADNAQRQALMRQDEQFIGHEGEFLLDFRDAFKNVDVNLHPGFRRSKLRATTVRMMLAETQGLPPLFWAHVDEFALRMFKFLHPVLTWVRMTWPDNGTNPSIQSIFQMIHKDTAYAAWLAVNVRLSPAVLNFDWRLPGERYLPDQIELYPEVHLQHRREVLEREFSEALNCGVAHSDRHNSGPPTRTARIMISVVPLVQRFTLIAGANGEEPLGFQRTTLLKPRVVYYHGFDNDQDDDAQFRQEPLRYSSWRGLWARRTLLTFWLSTSIFLVISIVAILVRLPNVQFLRRFIVACQALLGLRELPQNWSFV